jgi:hypothetical protein
MVAQQSEFSGAKFDKILIILARATRLAQDATAFRARQTIAANN